MSNGSNDLSKWEAASLALQPSREAVDSSGARRDGRRAPHPRGAFIKGPLQVQWLLQARLLGVTALSVGLCLWYLRGLRGTDSVVLSNITVREWGVSPDAKARALRALEKAGLVTIERRGKRSPLVTILTLQEAAKKVGADPRGPLDGPR
jgi:DNA-binding transcriptional ArsR family regulator